MSLLKDNLVLAGFLIIFSLLSIWLQFDLLSKPDSTKNELKMNGPDYYIENLASTAIDENGKKYRIIADRLVHYPVGDRSLLDNPQIMQYDADQTLSHTHAETGWLYDNQSTVLLIGNVRVVQSWEGIPRSVATSEQMTIHLKNKL